jgi:opacity protein-like surface antigen
MIRRLLVSVMLPVAMAATSGVARAQESGAGRIEIDSALLGGGTLFVPSAAPRSIGYVFDAAANMNVSRRIGIEGDFAWGMSREHAVGLSGIMPATVRSPNMLFYTANVVFSPMGHTRKFIPYAEAGGGALSALGGSPSDSFGLAPDSTHLTANIGGGVRWFPIPHWGVRGDYRYVAIRNENPPAGIGVVPVGHVQRLYGALVLTF